MKQIYLVEDNQDNADLILDLLSDDYEIQWFPGGKELLSFFEDEESKVPDIFLLDISLPDMDGVELLKRLRRIERLEAIPTVALTAHAMKFDKERFLDVGFNGYVSKPIVDEEELIEAIEQLTEL